MTIDLETIRKQAMPVILAAVMGGGGSVGYSEFLKPKEDSLFTETEKANLLNEIHTLKEKNKVMEEQLKAVQTINPDLINEKINNQKEQLTRIETLLETLLK